MIAAATAGNHLRHVWSDLIMEHHVSQSGTHVERSFEQKG